MKQLPLKAIRIGFAICLALPSCGPRENSVPAEAAQPANLHQAEFRISNQSFEDPLAYVAIALDDRQVFYGGLHVAGQHNHFRFRTSSEEAPSHIKITTSIGHPSPEGKTSKRQLSVDTNMPLKFDIDVHGENIHVHQVEEFVPAT